MFDARYGISLTSETGIPFYIFTSVQPDCKYENDQAVLYVRN